MGWKEFKEKLMSDKEYAKKYADAETAEDVVEIASRDGYNFTAEDVKNNSELTEAELEAAAGGTTIDGKGIFVNGNSIFVKNSK